MTNMLTRPGIVPIPIESERDRVPDDLEPHFGNDDDDLAPKKPQDGEPEQPTPF